MTPGSLVRVAEQAWASLGYSPPREGLGLVTVVYRSHRIAGVLVAGDTFYFAEKDLLILSSSPSVYFGGEEET